MKGGWGGRGQTDLQNTESVSQLAPHLQDHHTPAGRHLKVLVVVRIDAETGDEAVHHELHVCVLAACAPPERFGGVEEQSLAGTSAFETEATLRRHFTDGQGRGQAETFRSMTMDWTRRKMVE